MTNLTPKPQRRELRYLTGYLVTVPFAVYFALGGAFGLIFFYPSFVLAGYILHLLLLKRHYEFSLGVLFGAGVNMPLFVVLMALQGWFE